MKTLVEGLSPPYAPPATLRPSPWKSRQRAPVRRLVGYMGLEERCIDWFLRVGAQRNATLLPYNYSWPCPPTPRSTSNKNGAAAPSTICAGSASSSNGATLLLGFGRVTRTAVVQSDHVADRRHPLVAVRLRLRRELVVGRGAAAGESRRKLEGRRSGKGAAKTIPEHPVHVRGHGVAA